MKKTTGYKLNNNYGNEIKETLNNNKERNKEITSSVYLTLLLSFIILFLFVDNNKEIKKTNNEQCNFSQSFNINLDLEYNYSNINC